MALEQITFNIGAFNDANAGGNNYYTGLVFEVKNQSNNALATIYSDASGSAVIPQNGIDNVSNSIGECNFYIDSGDYYIEVDSNIKNFTAGISKLSFDNIDEVKAFGNLSRLIGETITTNEYHAGTSYGGASYEVVNAGSVTPNDMDIIQGVADSGASITLVQKGGRVVVEQLGINESYSNVQNGAIINRAFELAALTGAVHFDSGKDKTFDTTKITITSPTNVTGNFPTLRNTLSGTDGGVFYYNISGPAYIKVDGVNFRGDIDTVQLINHLLDSDPNFAQNFHIFADFEWNAGLVTDPNTGMTNTLQINNDPTTVKAAVHTRGGRFELGDLVQIEGFEAGLYLEGTSLANVGQNARMRFCEAGIQTRADRSNSNLKATMLNTNQTVIEYCYAGVYENELQDSIYYNTFITRCCIPTVSRNTTNVTHKKGYFELTHNMIDVGGAFQKDVVYEDCQWSFVNANAPFVRGLASGQVNVNSKLVFVRPDIKVNNQQQFEVDAVGDRAQIIFDTRYKYLPKSASWLYIKDEQNIPWYPDPSLTRGGVSIKISPTPSVALNFVEDYDNGNHIEVIGNGAGLDFNGAVLDVRPINSTPYGDSENIRLYFEYQYDDNGSGDAIPEPFGIFAGARRGNLSNLTATRNPVASGEWDSIEVSIKTASSIGTGYFSGGFNGTLRIRNIYLSIGSGHAKNYTPTPNRWFLDAIPTKGNWQFNDEVMLRPSDSDYRGAVCSVAGSPGTWKNYGAYEVETPPAE